MTAALAIRKAPDLDAYPPLRLVAWREEPHLPVVRGERCACGDWIQQHAGDDVMAVVAAHNRTPAHREWRARVEAG